MDLASATFGAWNPDAGEWQVVLPEIAAGRNLALFAIFYSNVAPAIVGPDGWTKEAEIADGGAGFYYVTVWTAPATGGESGHTLGWSGIGAGAMTGFVAEWDGGVVPVLVQGVDDVATIALTVAAMAHPVDASSSSQPSDLRVLAWQMAGADEFSVPEDPGVTLIGGTYDAELDLTMAVVLYACPPGGDLDLEATTAGNEDVRAVSISIRAQPMPRPTGLMPDAEPGRVGLEGDVSPSSNPTVVPFVGARRVGG
jgi:hypothetical protein